MSKIKILHFELDNNLGGIESFLLNLYKEIDRNVFQFDFITQSDKPALENDFLELGANIFKISKVKNTLQYKKDILKIMTNGYDIIHVHKNSLANIIPLYCANEQKIPVILHSHNTRPSVGKMTYILHQFNKNKAYKIVNEHFACSSEAGKWMYGNLPYDIVRNGILANRFKFNQLVRSNTRRLLEIPENALDRKSVV